MYQDRINKIGLVSCFIFLVGNIIYDLTDKSCPYDCTTAADTRFFFIPLGIMIFFLILICENAATGKAKHHWWFFKWLSIGQLVKFSIFDYFAPMYSDYAYLVIVAIGLILKFIKRAKPAATRNN